MKYKLIKHRQLIFIAVILGFLTMGGTKIFNELKKDPELAGKPLYSFLQNAEADNRDKEKNSKLIFKKNKKLCGVGILSDNKDAHYRAWILLNYSDDLNGVYTLTEKTYSLTQQNYNEIERFCKVDPRVSLELKKNLR